ncbi:MAG: hypothetical protein GWN58_32045 [Anaerolineae bacterium]|nr:hypothetical protein [Anaerolineae bacterium]
MTESARQLAEADDELRVTALEEILLSAYDGRLDLLMVASDEYVWGSFDPSERQAIISAERAPGDEDLLDRAAVEALRRGTRVHLAEADRIPGESGAAGLLRYSLT